MKERLLPSQLVRLLGVTFLNIQYCYNPGSLGFPGHFGARLQAIKF